MKFYKYQGTGNDFVMVDDRDETFPKNPALIEQLCHRRFGIGADGLILLQNAEGYDFRMVYYNADGNEGSMCGNGGRCTVRFAHDLGVIQDSTRFIAVDGEHLASVCEEEIFLKMVDVNLIEKHEDYDFLNTGSPHYVTYSNDLKELDVYEVGYAIRYADEWVARGGTNVNFVEVLNPETLFVRTYERGVEDETYSCGTGVTACAISAHLRHGLEAPIQIRTLGGNLRVSFVEKEDGTFEDVYLIGPAKRVFEGDISI
ncbi:MAG: diaminopimelate epimerase [Spirosomataceae bacterium]